MKSLRTEDATRIGELLSLLNAPRVDEVSILRGDPAAEMKRESLVRSVLGREIASLVGILNVPSPAGTIAEVVAPRLVNKMLSLGRFYPQIAVSKGKRAKVEWVSARTSDTSVERRYESAVPWIFHYMKGGSYSGSASVRIRSARAGCTLSI